MNGLTYYKPSGLVLSGKAVGPGVAGGGRSPPYPTIANSLIWVDRFRSRTDASGLVQANNGDSVYTISLPVGWGASLGTGLVIQTTSARRPTYLTNGLQSDGTQTIMSLPGIVNLSGAFAVYGVIDFGGAYNQPLGAIFGGLQVTFGGVIGDFNSSGLRCFDNLASPYLQAESFFPTGKIMVRIRRDASNNMYFAATGLAEVAKGSTSYTWPLETIMSRGTASSSYQNALLRYCQGVIVGADTVTAGTDAAIQAALIAREPGLAGISPPPASEYGFFRQSFGNYFGNYFGGSRS